MPLTLFATKNITNSVEWGCCRPGLPLIVSINVSGRQLHADSFITDVIAALGGTGLPPAALVIEITESILMRDASATIDRLSKLKAAGIRIAIDDFGTSCSSPAYLRQFPIDILKIDKSFIAAATGSGDGDALLHTLVQLGNNSACKPLQQESKPSISSSDYNSKTATPAKGSSSQDP